MEKGWYVIQTYSGYEQKIEKIITKYMTLDPEFKAYVTGVNIPMEKVRVRSDKDGEVKTEDRKILPGYLLVELQLPETGWHSIVSKIVGINGVSGFLTGDPNGKVPPKPLSAAEHKRILVMAGELPEEKTFRPKQDFSLGEEVLITAGPFTSFNGTIDEIDVQKGRLRLSVQIFGRSTPVEVDFNQVEKVIAG